MRSALVRHLIGYPPTWTSSAGIPRTECLPEYRSDICHMGNVPDADRHIRCIARKDADFPFQRLFLVFWVNLMCFECFQHKMAMLSNIYPSQA